jgi:hypothetical protein
MRYSTLARQLSGGLLAASWASTRPDALGRFNSTTHALPPNLDDDKPTRGGLELLFSEYLDATADWLAAKVKRSPRRKAASTR